jgi:hypothetical protein
VVRKKWRIKRVMAVPANWQGTPDRFYHFLLGYLVPLLIWQERTGNLDIAVRDSGPHNPWFELLRPQTSVEFLPPGMMLERYLSHRQERVVFHDWDNPTRFHRRALASARTAALNNSRSAVGPNSDSPRITILERRPSVEHYRKASAETPGGGADWRSIPNLGDIADSLRDTGLVKVVDTASMTPQEQVLTLLNTDLLIAQHGAGLSNMLWMESGRSVIEILPDRPPTIDAIFRNLAAARKLSYQAIPQNGEHAALDPKLIVNSAQALLEAPEHFIPTATGSLPMRLWRQMPRRL